MPDEFPPDTSTPPDPDNVILYDACRPPLLAGDYELSVDHELDLESDASASLPGPSKRRFTITGPRFTLDPTEVHAAYPPPNSEGMFEQRLPMVVLRRRTLPWERTLDGDAEDGEPWLALLLFEENEIKLLDPPDCTVGMCVCGDESEGVLSADIDGLTPDQLDRTCLGIQVPLATFKNVAPMKDEVGLLTHVRQVNTRDKELLGMDKDGWFAVVVGNRLPQAGKTYHACLVSLEGHLDHLPTEHEATPFFRPPQPAVETVAPTHIEGALAETQPVGEIAEVPAESEEGAEVGYVTGVVFDAFVGGWVVVLPQPAIRLVTLARWTFKVKGAGDFESLMEDIPRRGGVAMLGMSPRDAVLPDARPASAYNVALESGHVPLHQTTRAGEKTVAWYRGPLVPLGVDRDPAGPYHSADQARRLDPLTGLENLGYAAAFEIGRLLALSDPNFALELLRWRRSGHQRVAVALIGNCLRDRLPHLLGELEVHKLIEPVRLIEGLVDRLGGQIEHHILAAAIDPTGTAPFIDDLVGLDAQIVADAMGYETDAVEAVFEGTLVGSGALLDQLGVAEAVAPEAAFDRLTTAAVDPFGHLRTAHENVRRSRGGLR